jgi:hypothetical protein
MKFKTEGDLRGRNAELATNSGGEFMAEVKHLIEEWIEMRATLQRQLKLLESGEIHAGESGAAQTTIARIKALIDELNGLLKEFSRSHAL